MALLKIDSSEFADFVVCFLLDKLTKPNDVLTSEMNENFDDLALILNNKGMKSIFLKYYIDMNPKMRIQYKRMRKAFLENDKKESVVIKIDKEPIIEKTKGKTRNFLKKILRGI